MKFKKFFVAVAIVAALFYGGKYLVKQYLFPFDHEEAIMKYSKENNIDPYLVVAVIMAESRFDSGALSHKEAKGLMQITDDTGKWIAQQMNIKDYTPEKLYGEEYNIKMGCWYLSDLKKEFGDRDLYVAAYNAGRGRVNEWLSDSRYSQDGKTLSYIPYKETKEYVDKVNTYYKIYKKLYDK